MRERIELEDNLIKARKKIIMSGKHKKHLSNACKRCRKPLTDRISMERGYGPDCWEIILIERAKSFDFRPFMIDKTTIKTDLGD